MAEFKGTIFFGLRGFLVQLDYNEQSSAAPYVDPRDDSKMYKLYSEEGYYIKKMISLPEPEILLIQFASNKKNSPYHVIVLTTEMNTDDPAVLVQESSLMSFAPNTKNPNFISTIGSKFTVYKMDDSVDASNGTEYFSEFITKDAGGEIQAIDVSTNAVCFYANGKYRSFWFQTNQFMEVSTTFVERPFVQTISEYNFLIVNPSSMIVTGRQGEKPSTSIKFNQGLSNVENIRPRSFMLYQGHILEFFETTTAVAQITYSKQNPFKNIPVPKVKLACPRYELQDMCFMTDTEMYTIGGVSHGVRLAGKALGSGLDVALIELRRIKNQKDLNDVVIDMFKDLWVREKPANAKILAMRVVTEILWKNDVREIISLFPVMMLESQIKDRILLNGTKPIEQPDMKLMEALGNFLLATDHEYKRSTDPDLTKQIQVIDTCIFQFYAIHHQTRQLDDFMRKQNSIDMQLVSQFFNDKLKPLRLHPALAVFYTRTDKTQEALNLWHTLSKADKSNPRWALEASYTLQEVKTKKILLSNLAWIKEIDESAAVNALLYPTVDTYFALDWINDNCPKYAIKFYDFMVMQTDPEPKLRLVEDALMAFCKLLKSMADNPTFDVTQLTYNPAAASAKGRLEMMDDLATECCNKIARIIRRFGGPDKFDLQPYVQIVQDTPHRWLLFEFYSIGEMYDQAINLIFARNPDMSELEHFCRNAPHPEKAFSVAFKKMTRDGKDILTTNGDFLIKNLEWIDYEEMLDWIQDDTPLPAVERLITTASNLLIQKERLLHMQLDVANSMKVDADYRSVKAELRNVEIQHNTECQACNRPVGNGWLAVSPENGIYHITCKPQIAPHE